MNQDGYYPHADLTHAIIKGFYKVHDTLGFGFLESVYENALVIYLRQQGLKVEQQWPMNVYFQEEIVGVFKADIIVDDRVIIELKAVEELHPRHEAQLLNYLGATAIEVGLLVNFGEKLRFKRRIFSNDHKRALHRLPEG